MHRLSRTIATVKENFNPQIDRAKQRTAELPITRVRGCVKRCLRCIRLPTNRVSFSYNSSLTTDCKNQSRSDKGSN